MWDVTSATVTRSPDLRPTSATDLRRRGVLEDAAVDRGRHTALLLLAIISLSLGVINLFPSCRSTAATSSGAGREGAGTILRVMERALQRFRL
jgi:hypothetical protein